MTTDEFTIGLVQMSMAPDKEANLAKADIVRRGAELNVQFELTWSCYKGGEKHCGRCGTCIDRKEAFEKMGLTDPVGYAG